MFYKYFLFFENIYYCWSVLFNISCLPVKIVPHWSWNVRSVCILRTEILPPVLFEAPAFICCCSEHKNAPLVSAITIHDRMSLKRFYLLLHFIKLFKFFKTMSQIGRISSATFPFFFKCIYLSQPVFYFLVWLPHHHQHHCHSYQLLSLTSSW